MAAIYKRLFAVLLCFCLFTGVRLSEQSVLTSTSKPPGIEEVPTMTMSSLDSEHFTRITHPNFPGLSARIKRSDFCDGGVKTYTGYIDVGTRHLFFYFFESRTNPEKDDVVLWTNGGPGGSSAMGLFLELGPCTIESPNKTTYNPYSWNERANIFFIDQPAGTGFSYSDFGEIVGNTEDAAKDIAAFVAMFFETFSKFKGRALHLTGESYAGRYLPVYASAVYDQNAHLEAAGMTPVNLTSVMIGNGATDFFYLIRSYYDIQCTNASVKPFQTISACVRMKQVLPRCERWTTAACLNHFDAMDCRAAFNFCYEEMMLPYILLGGNAYDVTMRCDTNVDCYPEQYYVEAYLNSPDVRKTLGIDSSFGNYSMIAWNVNEAFWENGDALHPTQQHIAELLARGVRVLIYAGTYDLVANWVGNERWTRDMEWAGQAAFRRTPMREWTVDGEGAGMTRRHENFAFASVYGAGHLVPHDKPKQSLEMLNRWLDNKDL